MNGDPIILSVANFGSPVFAVRFYRGRVVHAITSLKQLGWTIRFDQTGRYTDWGDVSAGPVGITLCGERFG